MVKTENNKALVLEVNKLIEEGMTTLKACKKVGISRGFYYFWKKRLPKETKSNNADYAIVVKDSERIDLTDYSERIDLTDYMEMMSTIASLRISAKREDFIEFINKCLNK